MEEIEQIAEDYAEKTNVGDGWVELLIADAYLAGYKRGREYPKNKHHDNSTINNIINFCINQFKIKL